MQSALRRKAGPPSFSRNQPEHPTTTEAQLRAPAERDCAPPHLLRESLSVFGTLDSTERFISCRTGENTHGNNASGTLNFQAANTRTRSDAQTYPNWRAIAVSRTR